MSYTMELYFKPAVEPGRILQYFTERKHYRMAESRAVYENEGTGVNFWFTLRFGRTLLLRRVVTAAEFEVNFCRPSVFGLEAEIELSAFIAAFQPRISDPQMKGMGTGPYSGQGFLRGWNFGNSFGVRTLPSDLSGYKITTVPRETLRAAWAWNYRIPERELRLQDRQFVPQIRYFRMDDRPCTVAVWPLGMPISLPKVDFVLVGRRDRRRKRYGLAPWSEVLAVAESAGFDISQAPLELAYSRTPDPIIKWFQDIPLIDVNALEFLDVHRLLDEEAIEEAATLDVVGDEIAGDK